MLKVAIVSIALLFGTVAGATEYRTIERLASRSLVENFGNEAGVADSSTVRSINALALNMIKDFEGWEPRAYNDPAGYCTIGYGHLIALKRCETIDLNEFAAELSLESGSVLLENDTLEARRAIKRFVKVDLSDHQFGALAAFVFNVGETNFKSSTMLRKINDEDFAGAAKQFGRWVKADGVVLPGLVKRRACEATHFKGELEYGASGKFSRSLCNDAGIAGGDTELIDLEVGETN
ncbi:MULTISPECIES: lysozyme [unclassified Rhizobium]|uniref:lysozyme n=1 Tax=unclassified Rhizobium TaxID=2613769 RepID=UPI000BD33F5F|nr:MULTISPECIES: lysozyme [unclassified Rhizobium]MDH7809427.1 lysozyme [Rhizobium sp. AN67]SOD50282.1 lysozyme [Rhizobium sp. AN6A]